MYVPTVRELVESAGHPGLFLVMWVNREASRADLIALRDHACAIADVPFARLRPYPEYAELETR